MTSPGALDDLSKLDSKFARVRLYPGEVILPGKLMDSNDTSGSVKVPHGYRVVSVKSDPETSVSNLVEPGDRVDVVVVLRKTQTTAGAIAKTFLRAVRVFAVNREMSRSQDDAKSPESARTVSLMLKPDQVEKLVMAAQVGEIRLALRSPDDPRVDDTDGCTLQEILQQGGVADELGENGMLASLTRNEEVDWDPSADGSGWKMTLMTPNSTQEFKWRDRDELPEETSTREAPAATTADQDEKDAEEQPPLTPPTIPAETEELPESLEVAHSASNTISID
jgi:Flp pilus assembly protein CpaB